MRKRTRMREARSALHRRAFALLREQGWRGLAAGVGRHLRMLARRVLRVADFYIYRYPVPVVEPGLNRPAVDDLEVIVLDSVEDIGPLVARGYQDPRSGQWLAESRLAAGAVAVCGYAGRRLGYIGWVAMTLRAKRSFDRLPYRVAFEEGEGVTGGAWTAPVFRGLGMYRYMFGRELDLLRQRGVRTCRNAIGVANYPSQRGQACYGAEVCARGRLIRVLGRTAWTETPMSGPCPSLSGKPGGEA